MYKFIFYLHFLFFSKINEASKQYNLTLKMINLR
jgi:hypothetical protein